MTRPDLSDTLTALAWGVAPDLDHVTVDSAEISLPLLIGMERGPAGLRFVAQPPHSAFRSGFEPVAHRARLAFASISTDKPPPPGAAGRRIRNPWPVRSSGVT